MKKGRIREKKNKSRVIRPPQFTVSITIFQTNQTLTDQNIFRH